jgi:hypothetical protein
MGRRQPSRPRRPVNNLRTVTTNPRSWWRGFGARAAERQRGHEAAGLNNQHAVQATTESSAGSSSVPCRSSCSPSLLGLQEDELAQQDPRIPDPDGGSSR